MIKSEGTLSKLKRMKDSEQFGDYFYKNTYPFNH